MNEKIVSIAFAFAFLLINIGGFGFTIWFFKKILSEYLVKSKEEIKDCRKELTKLSENIHEIDKDLPKSYADKSNVTTNTTRIFGELDSLRERVATIEAKIE